MYPYEMDFKGTILLTLNISWWSAKAFDNQVLVFQRIEMLIILDAKHYHPPNSLLKGQ